MNLETQAEPPPLDGRTARWTRHREERRAELLDVARRIIHAQGPDVTMEDIAAASGTSKSIIYRYFSDKAQLQRAIGLRIFSTMQKRLVAEVSSLESSSRAPVTTDQRISVMIRTYVETAQRSPAVYAFVTRPSAGLNHFIDSVQRLVTQIIPATVPDPALWAAGAVGFVHASVDTWMRAQVEESAPTDLPTADQLTEHLVHWLMKGMQR